MKKNIFRIFDYVVALVRNSFEVLARKNDGAIKLQESPKNRSRKKTRFVLVQNLTNIELMPNEKVTLLFDRKQQQNHDYLFPGLTYRRKNRMMSGRYQDKWDSGSGSYAYRFIRGDGTTFYV